MGKKSALLTEPLFSDLDRRRCISLVEVSEVTGFPPSQLRIYAIDGTIPAGARRHLDGVTICSLGATIAAMALKSQAAPNGVITVPAEDFVHPPQMLEAIRKQEIDLWQAAYDELTSLGVENVPKPGP